MDTDNILYVIKVSFPLFTRRFHFGNECMICRKKKKTKKSRSGYESLQQCVTESGPCQIMLTKVMMSMVKLNLLACLY